MTRLFIILVLALPLLAQNYKPTSQTNPSLNFDSVLAGVKGVRVFFGDVWQKKVDEGERESLTNAIKQYLNYLGFNTIAMTSNQKKKLNQSFCDEISFQCWWEHDNVKLIKLGITFGTCLGDFFEFEISKPTLMDSLQTDEEFTDYMLNEWKQLYTRKKIYYNVKQRLSLPKLPTNWTEKSVMSYLDSARIDSIEGIYEIILDGSETITFAKYKIAVIKSDKTTYNVIYLAGATNKDDWDEGEIKAVLRKTAIPGNFKVQWYMATKFLNEDVHMEHDPRGILIVKIGTPPETNRYIKLYPIRW
ncbi:MAG: hypothetical protein LCH52_08520 [Bacteroidetes bacterium]|nr:hypothetical protein [Bacteroidota bacterium]